MLLFTVPQGLKINIGVLMFRKLLILLTILISSAAFSETIILKADNTVSLSSEVTTASVTVLMLSLQRLNELKTNDTIYLVLNTPGGSITDGIDFIRFAKTSRRPINTITIFAASMGFQIVEALPGKRLMAEGGVLMSHRAAVSGIGGQFPGELNVRVEFYGDIARSLDIGAANRAGITLKQYQDLIHDEYYALPSKAIKDKFADAEVAVSCDITLSGTRFEFAQSPFGPIKIELSSCPLIIGVVSAEFVKKTNMNVDINPVTLYTELRKKYGRNL
jgi:ATP-dependent protease ClpP protease subunit